jgi:hypothetical protein
MVLYPETAKDLINIRSSIQSDGPCLSIASDPNAYDMMNFAQVSDVQAGAKVFLELDKVNDRQQGLRRRRTPTPAAQSHLLHLAECTDCRLHCSSRTPIRPLLHQVSFSTAVWPASI